MPIRRKVRKIKNTPRRDRRASRKTQRRVAAINYIKRAEFWIGLATVLVVATLLINIPFKNIFGEVKKYRIQVVKLTPAPLPQVKPTAVPPKAQPSKAVIQPKIQKYTIQAGDSYFSATENVCGDGKFYTYNEELNGVPLQPGEDITIRCDWEYPSK